MLIGMYSKEGSTGSLELRTLADWVVRQRILTIPGVAQVITMGGGRKQYQVLVDLHQLHTYDVTLPEVESAMRNSNLNVTGGYVDMDAKELLVRGIGRVERIEDLRKTVIKTSPAGRPVLLEQLAEIVEAAQIEARRLVGQWSPRRRLDDSKATWC